MFKNLFSCLLLNTYIFANFEMTNTNCFLIKENNRIILQEGDCQSRHSPCSTFKIAISLMGYNENILQNERYPDWPFQEGYAAGIDIWKQPHYPALWIKNSCVWYSQIIIQRIGIKKFQDYITKFDYGNKDISADKDKVNGFNSWLSSTLQISANEQIIFLQRLVENKLPACKKSHEMTKNILFVENLANGLKLYGKTGAGYIINKDGFPNKDSQIGWFVGWIEKDNRNIIFAHYAEDKEKQDWQIGKKARKAVKEKLIHLFNSKTI